MFDLAKEIKEQSLNPSEILKKINFLADLLLDLRIKGYSGDCWGYNFTWQARRLFLFPKDTPTIVATSFCTEALLKAYELTGNIKYKNSAISSTKFILNDLNRTKYKSGFLFSYSPLNGNNTVFNASLLGCKSLIQAYKYTNNDHLKSIAKISAQAVCEAQKSDGSWVYGLLPQQDWIDSFHTGYNLESLYIFQKITKDKVFNKNIKLGLEFYLNSFFMIDGIPKYYHNKIYPVDIHCPAQMFVTLSKMDKFKHNRKMCEKVLHWTINNMQSSKGYFYYQYNRFYSSKISYMRWSNAFMFNAMSYYLKSTYVK